MPYTDVFHVHSYLCFVVMVMGFVVMVMGFVVMVMGFVVFHARVAHCSTLTRIAPLKCCCSLIFTYFLIKMIPLQ